MLHNIIDHRTDPHATNVDVRFECPHRQGQNEFGVDYITDTTVADAALWAQLKLISPVVMHVLDRGMLTEGQL